MKKTLLLISAWVLAAVPKIATADFTFGTPTNLGPTINSSQEDAGPCLSADGLSLYFQSRKPDGSNCSIYVSTRANTEEHWGEPVSLSMLDLGSTESFPSITTDGLELYYSDHPSDMLPGGYGSADIWVSKRADISENWGAPVNLGPNVNTASLEGLGTVSANGLSYYFNYEESGQGSGNWEIHMTTRTDRDADWSTPVDLGPPVNSSAGEAWPGISADGLVLLFSSNRSGGSGGMDMWYAKRSKVDEPWAEVINLGPMINSSAADATPRLSPDGSILYFASNRAGGFGEFDIFQAPVIPIVDFNDDGIVDAIDVCMMVDNWGTDNSLYDIGPMPWGDGIVDVEDLKVLAEHLFTYPGAVAHWKLDETEGNFAHESIGGSDDVVMGGPLWQPTAGKVGGALELDGVDDCVISNSGPNPADGPFSVFAWIKGGTPGQVIISQPAGANWLMADADGKLMTELKYIGGRVVQPPLSSQAVITDGQWHRIGFVWDGANRVLCVDGVVVAEDTQSGLGASSGGLYIGVGKDFAPGSFFSGLIDDVRVYNRAVRP